ncbi:DarT ssDNA thymidine ADP-ribosyltransferase family protein [Pseudoalteromonas carrageenovora]|uniref:DarT ssDNA thymidine ADP-ribosyltransferase family protein n=1 Tax=Pseudoalteromonas carrageenovora TaxID=227 RepID=UPI0026E386B3|nr:DarT ssDNA thymidine ADP-ribosyltransferase family protein [Pseudoalteromonas carrageenovora]MDO6464918.1 DarT ssDNA thymidine ADP-ribosyltransferase family protein [Pseudoalteromonas carrageenovora]
MGTGSNLAIELAEEKFLLAKEKWIRSRLGEDADENTHGWSELADEYTELANQEDLYLESLFEEKERRKEDIRKIVDELEVPALVHFTQLSNLESILKDGLLPRNEIKETVDINDELRLDGRENTVSTSIAFPNSKMFYKYRTQKGGLWCVIGISKRVLWELDCLFCKYNAADIRISTQADNSLETVEAFLGMFDESPLLDSRDAQKLRKYDPTDLQAEVLIKGGIPPKYIVGVVFSDKPSKSKFETLTSKRKVLLHSHNKGYFASRNYVRR